MRWLTGRNLNDLSDAGYVESEATSRLAIDIFLIQSRLYSTFSASSIPPKPNLLRLPPHQLLWKVNGTLNSIDY